MRLLAIVLLLQRIEKQYLQLQQLLRLAAAVS